MIKFDGPVAVLVEFIGAGSSQLEDLVERHQVIAEEYVSHPGLISKAFIRDVTTNTVGGMYVFESEASARDMYASDWWRAAITRAGVEPRFRYFEMTAYVTPEGVRPR